MKRSNRLEDIGLKVIATCDPSFEPIDQVQRLTKFSTGQLGVHLADKLARAGVEFFCLKANAATYAGPSEHAHVSLQNAQLIEALTEWLYREIALSLPVSALSP